MELGIALLATAGRCPSPEARAGGSPGHWRAGKGRGHGPASWRPRRARFSFGFAWRNLV